MHKLVKIKNFILIFYLFNSLFTCAQTFKLSGEISNNSKGIKILSLYKKHNSYYKEFIYNIPVVDNKFIYINNNIFEIDVYVIHNSYNNQFIQFIWDEDTKIIIDSISSFYKAKIINSPLDNEFTEFDSIMQDSLFKPIRELDRLITMKKKDCPDGCDSLSILLNLRENAEKFTRKNIIPFRLNYVKKHPNSFVSLFLLTLMGTENQNQEYREHFKLLDSILKKHSRASIYTD
jgi:hypothetical protein